MKRGMRNLGIGLAAMAVCAVLLWQGGILMDIPVTSETVDSVSGLGLVLMDSEAGPCVLAVEANSPADRAGVRPGDRLTSVDDCLVKTGAEADAQLKDGGDSLTVQRHGSELKLHFH